MPGTLTAYALLSAVYLIYLPDVFPVLDDWSWLLTFHEARAGGLQEVFSFLGRLADNTAIGYFRFQWVGYLPAFAVSFAAGFAAWPYFLLGWTLHLATAVVLSRIVAMLTRDPSAGFGAGAVYAVFAAANNALFWPVNSSYICTQTLLLAGWFCWRWGRIRNGDYRYRWSDLAFLPPVLLSGEQILPSLLFLLPAAFLLWGPRQDARAFLQLWLRHAVAVLAVLGCYALVVNQVPLARSIAARYDARHLWNPVLAIGHLAATLGFHHGFAQWHPQWRIEPAWLLALGLAAAGYFLTVIRLPPLSLSRTGLARMLAWSLAGVALTYLPVAPLNTFEPRFLYVPSLFLAPAAVAALGLLWPSRSLVLAFLLIGYSLSYTYFEARQCWRPQSRSARGILDAIVDARPIHSDQILVFSGGHGRVGFAPSFLSGASWSLLSAIRHFAGVREPLAGRDLVVDQAGNLALYFSDSLTPVHRRQLSHARICVLDAGDRCVPQSALAWPVPDGRFELLSLERAPGEGYHPSRTVTAEDLQKLSAISGLYLVRQASANPR